MDPFVQELLRRDVAERGMPAPAVVEWLDVVEGVGKDQPAFFVPITLGPPLCPGGIDSRSGQVDDNFYGGGVSAKTLGASTANLANQFQTKIENKGSPGSPNLRPHCEHRQYYRETTQNSHIND